MTNMAVAYQLGLEEVVAAIGLVGQPQIAKALLWSYTGELSSDEERGRLVAAHHSLMGHNLASVEQGALQLEPRLAEAVQLLVAHDYVLRFSRVDQAEERVLAYYFKGSLILRHQMTADYRHSLSFAERNGISADAAGFLDLSEASADFPEFEVSKSILDDVKTAAKSGPESTETVLARAGIPLATRQALSEDFSQPKYLGSLLRVEERDGALQSDRGFLLLHGLERLWLMEIVTRGNQVFNNVRLATETLLAQAIDKLSTSAA